MALESKSGWESTTLDDVSVYKQFKLTERLLNLNEEVENLLAWRSRNRYSHTPRDEVEMCDTFRTALKVFLIGLEPLLRKDRSGLDVNYWDGPLELGELVVNDDITQTNIENRDLTLTGLCDIVNFPDPIVGVIYRQQKSIGSPAKKIPYTVEIPIPWEVLERAYRHAKHWASVVGLGLDLEITQDYKGSRRGADYYEKAMKGHTWKIPREGDE
jgi:hypothetical protein|tara:strand:+ start:708 stop:1349 length:642 start_codon:yes stop_codon:yes gene_type:complete